MELDQQKKEVRQYVKSLKRRYASTSLLEMSREVMCRVEELEAFRRARSILAYWSLPDEVDTHDFVNRWVDKKRIFLPRVKGSYLEIRGFDGESSLQRGAHFGILEPQGPEIGDLSVIDFVVVPGVAFTVAGERLGRGGGYYDRLLPELKGAFKAGVAFSFQMMDRLPVDRHDVRMDSVLTSETQKPV